MTANGPLASHRGPALLAFVLFAMGVGVARSVDVPRAGYGIKSDEATYVAMVLSLVHDWNLSYERRDLDRFAGLYHQGPEGIFLKRGRQLRISVRPPLPFVHVVSRRDPDHARLYFGKAFAYPLFAAPFVWLYGLNGLLLFHVVLLVGVGVCGYLFLAAQSPPAAAALFTAAFLGAAALPVYGVFLMPEIFNVSLVFVAYFLWLYKEVTPRPDDQPASRGVLARPWTDVAAAVLLGLATYSKPIPNVFLVLPPVLLAWSRRRWGRGLGIGATAAAVAAVFFALTAAISGEFNYQGGAERKTFYGRFPFQAADATWESFPASVSTDGSAAREVLTSPHAPRWFATNLKYFVLGRHFGLVPYYFPGIVAVAAWLLSRARRDMWRILIFSAFMLASVGLLLVLPFTWSGGGGPPGNRYLVSAYPVLFFLLPPSRGVLPGIVAWLGGALFTAKMVITPFESAKFTWLTAEKGLLRRLPVELTMANDLPVMLAQPLRGRVTYSQDPFMHLYFLDQHAFPPEPAGMWVAAGGRADVIVRTVDPIHHLTAEAQSPIRTVLTVRVGAEVVTVSLLPDKPVAFDVPVGRGTYGYRSWFYLMEARSSEGFVPHLLVGNGDYRNLGAQMRFRAVTARHDSE
jgi:hypothetical protein